MGDDRKSREQRLAEALRANLRKRKAQGRELDDKAGAPAPTGAHSASAEAGAKKR